jgi:hypothetical protein
MRQDVKDKWVEALNSGKYRQIQGFLATNDGGRCAVGVLADIAAEAGIVVRSSRPLGNGARQCLTYDKLAFSLPVAALKWADITEKDTNVIMDMNDVGTSFQFIANWIKENL